MPINPVNLAPAGKAAGTDGPQSPQGAHGVRSASNACAKDPDSVSGFGAALDAALQGNESGPPESITARPPSAMPHRTPEQAATPAVPAPAAGRDEDDEAATPDAQLDNGLQAFVNSLQSPVTAMAMPGTSATDATDATDASSAADPADAAATGAEADGIAALAGDTRGKGRAHAFGLDEVGGNHSHTQRDAGAGSGGQVDALADAGTGKIDPGRAHAALRAREDTAGRTVSEFRAALHDAQAARPGLQETLGAENGTGSGLPQAIAAAAASGTLAVSLANAASAQAPHVAPHLYAPQWQDAFGQQVLWIAQHEHQVASITMHPPELGPVRVMLSVSDGQASAAFVSHQPEVRQAIQDAVPRLKEMFADAGLQLQQASVDSGDAGRHAASRAPAEAGSGRSRSAGAGTDTGLAGDALASDAASLPAARSIAASRLVDLFA